MRIKEKRTTLKYFVVTTEGPTIIGLPSPGDLDLITIHCAILKTSGPINVTSELISAYRHLFDHIGNYQGEYCIVLKPDYHLVIYAPRKYPIHVRDEIRTKLKDIEKQGIIRRISEPTEWSTAFMFERTIENFGCVWTQRIWTEPVCIVTTKYPQQRSLKTSSKVLSIFPNWTLKMDTGPSSSM